MDPTILLSEIRSMVQELDDTKNEDGEYYAPMVSVLLDRWEALDEWMSRGGFAPLPWRN